MQRILIIEDEPNLADFIVRALQDSGYEAKSIASATNALETIEKFRPSLLILDVMLPGITGFEFLVELRKSNDLMVLMLTALGGTKHKVQGLDSGADDYLAKPFKLEEMLARVHALLRRNRAQAQEITCGPLKINLRSRKVTVEEHQLFLSQTEFGILEILAHSYGQPVTKTELLDKIWDDTERGKNVVEVYIHFIRQKIEIHSKMPLIHTIRGKGYLLSTNPWDADQGGAG